MQNHLNREIMINLGSYYTPIFLVNNVYKLLEKWVDNLNDYIFLDSSCGYGDFFIKDLDYIGCDIDKIALSQVKNARIIHTNSLVNVDRKKFNLSNDDKLIIIGNPPYNDKTSIIRSNIKKELFYCDKTLIYRDLGISFLRSYEILKPEFICILHPLSYLIKKTNFNALAKFKNTYKLIDGLIVSSEIFTPKSNTFFPIIIAFYKRDSQGMNYEYIKNYTFKTIEGNEFILKNYDSIANYVPKYPNQKDTRKAIAYFHTLRDINALKRNQTFMLYQNSNSIKVFEDNLKYYVYIHFFKKYSYLLPYYFGNLDIFINHHNFLKIEDEFLN
ncbi:hypothetical protein F8872_08480, partial [Campylobacter coli]|nr:hypothetical protein [Campylobacter coli]EAJ3730542.1 hypothetical protein [Campylobacter jejuni]EDB0587315.1 hypothetical protein [Campylobacter coli]EEO9341565.1 hypothetical protein [Campylobacter jejuni]EGO3116567.1 hypothetical protein [Campylobacter coli]